MVGKLVGVTVMREPEVLTGYLLGETFCTGLLLSQID